MIIALFLLACDFGSETPAATPAPSTEPTSVAATASEAAPKSPAAERSKGGKGGKARRGGGGGAEVLTRTDWVTNPTSQSQLAVYHATPVGDGPFPALVLVPGGTKEGSRTLRPPEWAEFVKAGFAIVTLDPDGRGQSSGEEDFNGHIHQDGLAAVIDWAAARPEIDGGRIGVVSFSYGVTMAVGALSRHSTPAKFLIDWEGPASRTYTAGCNGRQLRGGGSDRWKACDDEAFWGEREAASMVSNLTIPYHRVQFTEDHAQPDAESALTMVRAARSGGVPWTRVNNEAPDKAIDALGDFQTLPDPRERSQIIAGYAAALMAQTTGQPVTPGEVPAALAVEAGSGGGGGGGGKKGKGKRKQR